ncbi:MAG: GCN5 family acetyltransferase [Desulfobulbaceae bacterium BRH_c16a]|nr:MAG: GCN5 family acetyltransferase [Desulfobulbaceae bacterium BRH_c16a]
MMIFGDKIMTPRLRLRRITESDLPLLVAWSNSDAAHGRYLTPDRTDEVKGRENLVMGMYWNDVNRVFLIELKGEKPIGTLRYWLRSERRNCAVMAIKISIPQMRDKGYGTEAQKYVIMQLFQRLKVQSVEMYTDINNRPQQRCLQKLGFELVETLGYDDHQVKRVGHLFRLDAAAFVKNPVYQYHYEQ